ncbi:GNAT family N-acetyltransferase [Compostibacter hankyongensis]|uniref:N-acetyltransferase domain-containing protein n=1 Tax=Compostibacter hankyongensis TaxID=1007089 RepID=A0ABP8FCJ1_9BACT
MIVTPRLFLYACELKHYEAVLQGGDALSRLLNTEVPEKWTETPELVLVAFDKMKSDPSLLGWFFYFIVHQRDNRLIGTGGFKGKPSASGAVEIGYEIVPDYRDQGYATETASALIDFAFSHSEIRKVVGHTLSEFDAAVRVLQKAGLQFVKTEGSGDLCRWEITRAAYTGGRTAPGRK